MMKLNSGLKTALISGASSGIGKALSILLAKNGYTCIIVARRQNKLDITLKLLTQFEPQSFAIAIDLMDPNSPQKIANQLLEQSISLDLIILNAGQSMSTKDNPSAYSQLMTLNYTRNMELITALKPTIKSGGQIVGISSLASFTAATYAGAYSASKAAFNRGLESIRREYYPDKIDVSIICPGFIKTELTSVNNYDMPFLMELENAARKIFNAIQKRKKLYCVPWQLALVVKIGLLLPVAIQDYLLRSTPHDKANTPKRDWGKIDLNKLN